MNTLAKRTSAYAAMNAYQIGDKDDRPWGHYVVTSTGIDKHGDEYCEKVITIKPGKVLSLQSHNLRRETWTVKKGILTALRDGQRLEILPHESIRIPMGSVHCMANLEKDDCVVEERQEGVCREEDIKRYIDAYHRKTEELTSPTAIESLTAYQIILSDIKKISENEGQCVS